MSYDIKKLKKEQYKLSERVELKDSFSKIKYIAGAEVRGDEKQLYCSIVVLDMKNLELLESASVSASTHLPYIPGYLGFREGPAIVEAFNKLRTKPELLIIKGHGILHPRKLGLASHVGLLLDIPTIGVTNRLLVGEVSSGKVYVAKDFRGFELITKEHAKPIYVSPGHKITLGTSLKIIKDCLKGHKLPEPLQIAHRVLNKMKKEIPEE